MRHGFSRDGESSLSARLAERKVVPVPSDLFDVPERLSLLHHAVMSYLASTRTSYARNKGRSDVNYSKQDRGRYRRAGRARRGELNASNMRGGGRAFAKTQMKNWKRLLNGKAWVAAMATALSLRWRDGAIVCIDGLPQLTGKGRLGYIEGIPVLTTIDKAPERETRFLLDERGLLGGSGTLFLLGHDSVEWHDGYLRKAEVPKPLREPTWFVRALRRLTDDGVEVKRALDVNIVELLRYRRILFDEAGLSELVARLRSERGLLGSPVWPLRVAGTSDPEDEDDDSVPTSYPDEDDEDDEAGDEPDVVLAEESLGLIKRAKRLGGVEVPESGARSGLAQAAQRGHEVRFGA
jgi:hypothetical protein